MIVSFVVLNRQDATFYYSPLATPLNMPMWLMGLVLFAIGFVVGATLLWINSWSVHKELKQTKKDLAASEAERTNLLSEIHHNQIEKLDNNDPYSS